MDAVHLDPEGAWCNRYSLVFFKCDAVDVVGYPLLLDWRHQVIVSTILDFMNLGKSRMNIFAIS
jgi:hypothetical protein